MFDNWLHAKLPKVAALLTRGEKLWITGGKRAGRGSKMTNLHFFGQNRRILVVNYFTDSCGVLAQTGYCQAKTGFCPTRGQNSRPGKVYKALMGR